MPWVRKWCKFFLITSSCGAILFFVVSTAVKYNAERRSHTSLFIIQLYNFSCDCLCLKAVLLHNSNVLASIPLAHSTKLSESYETLKLVLEKIKYHEHDWQICGDLKVIGFLLEQQRDYTKYPCFLCEWDSRATDKHWDTVHWPEREQLQPGSKISRM